MATLVSHVQAVSAWTCLGPCHGGRCCEEGAGLCAIDNVGQVWHPCSSQGRDCPMFESCRHMHTASQIANHCPVPLHGRRCRALLTRAICCCRSRSPSSVAGTMLLLPFVYAIIWLRLICTQQCFLSEACVTFYLASWSGSSSFSVMHMRLVTGAW